MSSSKSLIRELFKDSFVYGLANAINKAINLMIFPLLTRYFNPEEYGLMDSLMIFSTLTVTAIIFGQDSAIARFFYEYKDLKSKKNVVTQSLLIQLLTLVIFLAGLWILMPQLEERFIIISNNQNILKLIIYQIPFLLLLNFSANILRWNFEKNKFLFVRLGSITTYLIGVFLGIRILKINLEDVFKIYLFVNCVFGIIGFAFVRKWIDFSGGKLMLKPIMKYAAPYGIICIVGALIPAVDRVYISNILGLEYLGFYAAGLKIVAIISLPIQAFLTAWGPLSLSVMEKNNKTAFYQNALNYYVLIFSILLTLLSIFGEDLLITLAGGQYLNGAIIIFPIALSIILKNLSAILSIGLDIGLRSEYKLVSYFTGLIVTITIFETTTEAFGLLGIASGILLGEIFKLGIETYFSFKTYKIDFDLRKAGLIFFFQILSLIFILFIKNYILSSLLINLTIISVFTFICIKVTKMNVLSSKLFKK